MIRKIQGINFTSYSNSSSRSKDAEKVNFASKPQVDSLSFTGKTPKIDGKFRELIFKAVDSLKDEHMTKNHWLTKQLKAKDGTVVNINRYPYSNRNSYNINILMGHNVINMELERFEGRNLIYYKRDLGKFANYIKDNNPNLDLATHIPLVKNYLSEVLDMKKAP